MESIVRTNLDHIVKAPPIKNKSQLSIYIYIYIYKPNSKHFIVKATLL